MLVAQQYEKNIPKPERKKYGQFYTPEEIVEYIIENSQITKDSKILDPSCGCGSFLVGVANKLKKLDGSSSSKNIYGVDINPEAVTISKKILYEKFGRKINLDNNIIFGNTITKNKKIDSRAIDLHQKFKAVLANGGFDVILGNPPYVTLKRDEFDSSESLYPKITNGVVNCATLMIGRGLELLKDGGILGFLLPKSVIRVDSYSKLRKFLLENTQIKTIFDLGSMFKDVRGEQIILIIKKQKPLNNKIAIKNFTDKKLSLFSQPGFSISQKEFIGTDIFPVYDSLDQYRLIKKIDDENKKLSEFASIFRGLGIGANSDNVKDDFSDGFEKVFRGDSIKKFGIKYPLYIKSDIAKNLSDSKYNKLKQPKVIVQNIFSRESGIVATIDKEAALTLDTVTNIIPKNKEDLHYILGVLNSKLANFYLIFAIYYKSLLTMHTDSTYLGRIPFRYVNGQRKKRVIELVKKQLKNYNKKDETKLDNLIYSFYGLQEEDIGLIENSLKMCWKGG